MTPQDLAARDRDSMRRSVRRARVGALTAALVGAVVLGRGFWLEHSWARGFARIQRGDARAQVTETMGGRGHEHACAPRTPWAGACTVAVSYAPFPFLERWTFEIDAQDRVVASFYREFD